MSEWTKVVTEPLGLAGFALFLVFGLFSTLKRHDERRWLSLLSATMAMTVLIGCLGLAFLRVERQAASEASKTGVQAVAVPESGQASMQPKIATGSITTGSITTSGDASPVVVGGSGQVTVNMDQSAEGYKAAAARARAAASEGRGQAPSSARP